MSRVHSSLLPLLIASMFSLNACSDRESSTREASTEEEMSVSDTSGAQQDTAVESDGSAQQPAATAFQPYSVVDQAQGGLVVGTLAVPEGWNAKSNVQWNYSDVSFPVRASARIESADGSAWMESFPAEMFYWLEPRDTSVAVGGRTLGMIHAPGIDAREAIRRFVIARYRQDVENLEILGFRPIGNLAQALGNRPVPGDSIAVRVRYSIGGKTVDEEFFGLLSDVQRIPYHGPQGTTYENHRVLTYTHSMGATDGKLDSLHLLLGFVAASWRPDPVWEQHSQQIYRQLSEQFNQYIAAGYARIAAAGQLSRTISANNDAMLQSMQAQRQASNVRSSAQREEQMTDSFSEYIRGVETMKDPYWGTSEQAYTEKYHWTDGQGNYRHSNDSGFDPNQGSSVTWERMEPAN